MRRVMVLKMLEWSVCSIVSSSWDRLYIHSHMCCAQQTGMHRIYCGSTAYCSIVPRCNKPHSASLGSSRQITP